MEIGKIKQAVYTQSDGHMKKCSISLTRKEITIK